MSFEPVDIQILDAMDVPVSDVLVKIYNPAGTVFFTQGITNSDGLVGFLLETLDYSMRFYKYRVGFQQPQLFTVLAAPETNTFDVVAEPFILPIASDARLCRCSGYFRDLDGSPKRNLDIHFIAQFDPVILDDAGVVTGERHIRTDQDGYAQIDLIRGANYTVVLEEVGGFQPRCVSVPDAASTNLPDLLFPIAERVVLPAGPIAISIGVETEIFPQVFDSSGRPLLDISLDVNWSLADPSLAYLLMQPTKLTIRGTAAGTTELRAERKNKTIIKIPDTPMLGQPVSVVVS